jgi:hypothetical protein
MNTIEQPTCPACGGNLVETARAPMFKNSINAQTFRPNYVCCRCGVGVHRSVVDFERSTEQHRHEFRRGFGPYCDDGPIRQITDF